MTNKVYLREILYGIDGRTIHVARVDIGVLVKISPNFRVELAYKSFS